MNPNKENNISEKRIKSWLTKLFVSITCVLVILAMATWIVDPFLYYRINDSNHYLLNARFCNKGIIKNYDYDTVIIGSSMIQNFSMQSLREKSGWKPVKLTIGGMKLSEIEQMVRLASEQGRVKRFIINVDIISDADGKSRFPEYLYNHFAFDDVKYLLGYEAWMRFIPVDLMFNLLYRLNISLPEKFEASTKIDYIEDWSLNAKFGADVVLKNYLNKQYAVSTQNTEGMYQRLCSRFDDCLNNIDINSEKEYIILFPPYSALFWYNAEKEGYKDIILEVKKYLVAQLLKHKNIRIVDMQNIEEISDLNNYKDTTHFNLKVQEKFLDAIVSRGMDIQFVDFEIKIDQRISELLENYPQLNY